MFSSSLAIIGYIILLANTGVHRNKAKTVVFDKPGVSYVGYVGTLVIRKLTLQRSLLTLLPACSSLQQASIRVPR